MDVAAAVSGHNIIDTGVQNAPNVHTFSFKKKFNLNVKSTKYGMKVHETNQEIHVDCYTYVHSLPWQYIYFYLTEKEYDDIRKIHHSARVASVTVKIVNLGNRTPFITSAKSVSYANANSQTTIGIWENLESVAIALMGKNITPKVLYGSKLSAFKATHDLMEIGKDHYGATSQAKHVDNRIILRHITQIKEGTASYPMNDQNMYIPSLLMQASIFFNATNSLGTIFERTYVPQDGTFHKYNDGLHHNGIQPRSLGPPVQMEQTSGIMRELRMIRPGYTTQPKYEDALIDNIRYSSLTGNPGVNVLHSLGVGIVPLLNQDETLENSVFNFMVETSITLEASSHGTNLLMGSSHAPQPNQFATGLMSQKRQWLDAFGVGGLPIVAEEHEPLPNDDDDPGIIGENAWSRAAGTPGTTVQLNALHVPGQRRVTGKMTPAQRKAVFENNLEVRKAWLAAKESIPGHGTVTMVNNFRNLQYALPKGAWDSVPSDRDEFWTQLNNVGKKNAEIDDHHPRESISRIDDHNVYER